MRYFLVSYVFTDSKGYGFGCVKIQQDKFPSQEMIGDYIKKRNNADGFVVLNINEVNQEDYENY